MQLIVDLHIHSHYAYATSKQMNTEDLYRWGKIKGINIIGTGDFTHPEYFKELKEKLEPAEQGLFKLKEEYASKQDELLPNSVKDNLIRFVLTVEVSNIYHRHSKLRKVHNVIIVPDFNTAEKIISILDKKANLRADGRPTISMDSKDLLQITLDANSDSLFVPAHIWTPWFGIFGSKSGFDSLEEAFGELTSEIKAIETGLSSDPNMNWRIGELQDLAIISNSDAHSPWKLGREATVIDSEISYEGIIDAIKKNDGRLIGTIEFYPEEGKYHYDGHRNCKVSFNPKQTKEHNGLCPVCGKRLIIGVQNRVDSLSSEGFDYKHKTQKTTEYIIPLVEIIAESKGIKATNAKTVVKEYDQIIERFGNEFNILRKLDLNLMSQGGFSKIANSIDKMRKGEVDIEPGYDGVFGKIKISNSKEETLSDQKSMFA